jgi:hypothetical protein
MEAKAIGDTILKSKRYLYRGVSEKQHREKTGLTPKNIGVAFKNAIPLLSEKTPFKLDRNWKVGNSEHNAAYVHQRADLCKKLTPEQYENISRSGISSTPILERAIHYATKGCEKNVIGYVYKIDRGMLRDNSFHEYDVNKIIPKPHVPEDHEIILVSSEFGALPMTIVSEILRIEIV